MYAGAGFCVIARGYRAGRRYHPLGMAELPASVRSYIDTGPLAHLVTLDPDGRPQVSMAWVGLDGDAVVIGTLFDQAKLRNLRADPRIALSFAAPDRNEYGLDHYLVLHGHARVTEGGAAALLGRLEDLPGTRRRLPGDADPPPGFVIRVTLERLVGIGDWG
jgi:PPOX class probable F420-dependent enzyme